MARIGWFPYPIYYYAYESETYPPSVKQHSEAGPPVTLIACHVGCTVHKDVELVSGLFTSGKTHRGKTSVGERVLNIGRMLWFSVMKIQKPT